MNFPFSQNRVTEIYYNWLQYTNVYMNDMSLERKKCKNIEAYLIGYKQLKFLLVSLQTCLQLDTTRLYICIIENFKVSYSYSIINYYFIITILH